MKTNNANMMTSARPSSRTTFLNSKVAILAIAMGSLTTLSACNAIRGGGGSGGTSTIVSDANQRVFDAKFDTKAYTYHDDNTADIYLTDLSDQELTAFFAPNSDWSQISGILVHVHLFLDPKPGKTPIEHTAATASIRYGIIANGQIGIYDGAGFMIPGSKPGNDSIGGTIRSAPLRLTRASDTFEDLFLAAKIDLEFSAKLNDASATELGVRLDAMAAKAKPVRN
ncbi:MAG: hypothetical protein P1U42_12445 [Phycisphaerales bacterium]|nr:hypothetical protein [Phycisphaerales bacterium]